MRNPCTRCLELDFCQEGKYGEPCIRRRQFEEYVGAIRLRIWQESERLKSEKEGDVVAGDKGKGQLREGNPYPD